MTELTALAYVPDPFAVQSSRFCMRNPEGVISFVSGAELATVRGPILTYDVPALVDDLRRLHQRPPIGLIDIGDAIRLRVGLPRDEGGEKRWNIWRAIGRHFDNSEDAKRFQAVVQARVERPDADELARLLGVAVEAVANLWSDVSRRLDRDELERLFKVEWPLQRVFTFRQFHGLPVDSAGAQTLLSALSKEKYSAYRAVAETLNISPTGLNFWNIQEHLHQTDVPHLKDVSTLR